MKGFDVRKRSEWCAAVHGRDSAGHDQRRRPQRWENLSIYSKLYGIPREERQTSIDELLELVDLNQWRDTPARKSFGGMRRRLEIARGLVHGPRIFFLDEPTTGLIPFLAWRFGI